ncbi:hypothetical protein SDC9_127134 [bioreactor metagenome]|uniref:Uncharacterized protein n=1 Tax=bioreactor metagenome TaxID=1076179 RepID=A0A645CT96_9ZZZZ
MLVDDGIGTMNSSKRLFYMHHDGIFGKLLADGKGGNLVVHANQSSFQIEIFKMIEHQRGGMVIIDQ